VEGGLWRLPAPALRTPDTPRSPAPSTPRDETPETIEAPGVCLCRCWREAPSWDAVLLVHDYEPSISPGTTQNVRNRTGRSLPHTATYVYLLLRQHIGVVSKWEFRRSPAQAQRTGEAERRALHLLCGWLSLVGGGCGRRFRSGFP